MKKATLLAVFFMAMLTLTACSNKQTANPNSQADNQNGGNGRDRRLPDFGQPEGAADISGLVKSVVGNQVTIIKMDRPNRGQATSTPADGANGQSNNQNRTGNNLGRTLNGGTGGGGRFMGGGGPGPDGQSAASRTAMLEQIKKMSSGEAVVTIPVGIKMLKPDTSAADKQLSMVEATLADVTADKMINIWTDETADSGSSTDKKVASFVLIMR